MTEFLNKRKEKPMKEETCPCCVNEQHVADVRARMISPERCEDLAAFFKMLGASSRVGILYALSVEKEMCVGDLASLLDMAQPRRLQSAQGAQAGAAGQEPPGRKDDLLRPFRRASGGHHPLRPGTPGRGMR